MMGLMPKSLQVRKNLAAPNRLPWSVMAQAGMPKSLAREQRSLTRMAPSRRLYSVWQCRCTKSDMRELRASAADEGKGRHARPGRCGRPCPAPGGGCGRRARTRRSKSIAGSRAGLKAARCPVPGKGRTTRRLSRRSGSAQAAMETGRRSADRRPVTDGEGQRPVLRGRPRGAGRAAAGPGRPPRCAACRPSGPDPRWVLPGCRRRPRHRPGSVPASARPR